MQHAVTQPVHPQQAICSNQGFKYITRYFTTQKVHNTYQTEKSIVVIII